MKRFSIIHLLGGALVLSLAMFGGSSVGRTESIITVLPYVVENHDRVRAAKADVTAARNRAREALGAWFPTFEQTANIGHEKQNNFSSTDSATGFAEYDLKLTQLLWDFGVTNSAVEKARLSVDEAKFNLITARQTLIQEATDAYMEVIKARQVVDFAKQSETNIRRQTGLEEALVGLGSGFSTDVLQAKRELAGAETRRSQNEGTLITALNAYRKVFGALPADIGGLEPAPYPSSDLPISLNAAIDLALERNPEVKLQQITIAQSRQDLRSARGSKFFPKIEWTGERKFKDNVGGTLGTEQETLSKIELNLPFNLGFTAINTLRAAKSDLSSAEFTAGDTRRNIEEQVRNAWEQLETAKRTTASLRNQANIAGAFLELARNERKLGRRSLIDVLSGETALINAQSDAAAATADVIKAAYGVLKATGQLDYAIYARSRGVEPPIPMPQPATQKPVAVGSTPTTPVVPAAAVPSPAPTTPVTPAKTAPQSGSLPAEPSEDDHGDVAVLGTNLTRPSMLAEYEASRSAKEAAETIAIAMSSPRTIEPVLPPESLSTEGQAEASELMSADRNTTEQRIDKLAAYFSTRVATSRRIIDAERTVASLSELTTQPVASGETPIEIADIDASANFEVATQLAISIENKAAQPEFLVTATPSAEPVSSPIEDFFKTLSDGADALAAEEAANAARDGDAERQLQEATIDAPLPPASPSGIDDLPSDDPLSALVRVIDEAFTPGPIGPDEDTPKQVASLPSGSSVEDMPAIELEAQLQPRSLADDGSERIDDPITALFLALGEAFEGAATVEDTDRAPAVLLAPAVEQMPEAEPVDAPDVETVNDSIDIPSDDPISALFRALGTMFEARPGQADATAIEGQIDTEMPGRVQVAEAERPIIIAIFP